MAKRQGVFHLAELRGLLWPMSCFLYISFGKKNMGKIFVVLHCVENYWHVLGTSRRCYTLESMNGGFTGTVPITHEKKGTLKILTKTSREFCPSRSFSGVENPPFPAPWALETWRGVNRSTVALAGCQASSPAGRNRHVERGATVS